MLRKLRLGESRDIKLVAAWGLLLLGIRVGIGLLLIVLEASLGEADLLLLFDVPTVAVYFFLARVLGYRHNITNVYDVRFFVTGVVTWMVLGLCIGFVVLAVRKRSANLSR